MTAREFAAAIDRPYSTVALWLRQKRIPGAYQETVGDFSLWQIPVEAVDEFKPPTLGRPSKKQATTDGEVSTATDAPDDGQLTVGTGKKMSRVAIMRTLRRERPEEYGMSDEEFKEIEKLARAEDRKAAKPTKKKAAKKNAKKR